MDDESAAVRPMLLDRLEEQPSDSLIALIALAGADRRREKIDVGVGVYRDGAGNTPILRSVKAAERILLETQETKAYIGSQGDARFVELIKPIVFGESAAGDDRIVGLQTPGGCGALRLGAELIAKANRDSRIFVGEPTWPNHQPLIGCVGVEMVRYPYYDKESRAICFERMTEALNAAEAGDVVLLHGCCHNPTGADLDPEQWQEVAELIRERRLIPFVDLAYQGFGDGFEADAAGTRLVVEAADQAIVAQSCDKNFSCYRDRVGSLFVKTGSKEATARAMGHVFQRAREMWSMPPDHGAAAAHIILEDPQLRADWLVELTAMRDRINSVRQRIAAADPRLAFIGKQFGMFSMLPLSKEQVLKLRSEHAIYMAESGRFNVVGMSDGQIDRFTAAVIEAMDA
jgi:aspartate/tyrosine/aromatic aminotransferase